uniref:Uncharacterized protein n=1 Tax=Nelumbo nucifera TaxID=4432 RepID=A0A822XUW7_NELNU|nr:TPA_asm: hypothetical protein HUJ06_025623 [Nelumbo nucifera]
MFSLVQLFLVGLDVAYIYRT